MSAWSVNLYPPLGLFKGNRRSHVTSMEEGRTEELTTVETVGAGNACH